MAARNSKTAKTARKTNAKRNSECGKTSSSSTRNCK